MDLQTLLALCSRRHSHLCPRQVLGVRMGLLAVQLLEISVADNRRKPLVSILESDGCFADGVEVATECTLGHRTLRIEDYGKVAATFADTRSGRAIRIAPRLDLRERAYTSVQDESRHYFTQLQAYKVMPAGEMFTVRDVFLTTPLAQIISRPGLRVICDLCGEEITNGRQISEGGSTFCRACTGDGYYQDPEVSQILPPALPTLPT